MSQVPKYPYRVVVTRRAGHGNGDLTTETHNYANFSGAMAYREIALSKPLTRKVEIAVVIDESTPSYDRPGAHYRHSEGGK